MNDGALRQRLEALNRGPLPAAQTVVARAAKAAGSPRIVARTGAEGPAPAWRAGRTPAIPGLLRRGEPVATGSGEHLRVCLAVDELWPGGESLVARRYAALTAADASGAASCSGPWLAEFPHAAAFLDLETCGLSGSPLFLAGLLLPIEGRLSVELLLARDYSEELAVLATLWDRLAAIRVVLTFNGKSFDWPMIVDRSRRHLMRPSAAAARCQHVDLLHLARRRWRRELPDCKLQTLERHICGRHRAEDMASRQIPAAYQLYVRTGVERDMDAILLHNALDLVTMLDLAMRLAGEVMPPRRSRPD